MSLLQKIEEKRNRQIKKDKNKKIAIATAGVATGAVVGTIAGVLIAPKSGKETIEDVKEKSNQVKNKINEDSITFKEMDIFDVKKKYNNKYDFINFSNISNYVDTKKFISYIKQLLEDNLYNDGEIILDYIWEYSEKFQSFAISLMDLYELNPNIITFNNNYNGNDAVVVKKKKRS